ncbi:MAG: class F sortase, partial [Acidimicrobiales bacterium]
SEERGAPAVVAVPAIDADVDAEATADSPDQASDTADPESSDTGSASPLADLITELPPASTGLPQPDPEGPQPIGLTIESLGINVATVIDVGVEDNGDMEVPAADEVGWYRYGPAPGQEGSSVLAAHIAYDGVDGVFVNLDDLALGSIIAVEYDDGSIAEFEAVATEQYNKQQLPKDSIFARTGEPQLVLITCGGEFNRQVRSYDDNIVVYANPL